MHFFSSARRRTASPPPRRPPPSAPPSASPTAASASPPSLARHISLSAPCSSTSSLVLDMDHARKRWFALARDRRAGLSLASDELETAAASIDSISLNEPMVRHGCTPPPSMASSAGSASASAHPSSLPSSSAPFLGRPPTGQRPSSMIPTATPVTPAPRAPPMPVPAPEAATVSPLSRGARGGPSSAPVAGSLGSQGNGGQEVTPTNSPAVSRPSLSDYSPAPALSLRVDYAGLTALKEKFITLDAEGKGFLSRAQFYQLFESMIDPDDEDDDTQGSGENNIRSPMFNFAYNLFVSSGERLNLKEFVTGMTVLSSGTEEDRLRYLFMMYDSDNSGELNAEEIKQVFRIMNSYATSHEFQPTTALEKPSLATMRRGNSSQLEELALNSLKEHDMDGDGHIGFDDFSKWCTKDPVVKTWMDSLSNDITRGVARLRGDREKRLIARELESLGMFPQSMLYPNTASPTLAAPSGGLLPPSIRPVGSDSSGEFERAAAAARAAHAAAAAAGHTTVGHTAQRHGAPADASTNTLETPSRSSSAIGRPSHTRTETQIAVDSFKINFHELVFEREVGSGSFAVVWRCRWLDSPVAVKVFRSGPQLRLNSDGTPALLNTDADDEYDGGMREAYNMNGESFEPEFDSMASAMTRGQDFAGMTGGESGNSRVRFMQEISLLKSIRHPNLLLYMGACVDPAYPLCIVSELIDGGSLFELLHGANAISLSIKQKMELVRDIARGMLYLHGREPIVLHRDLKSANILVERQNDNGLRATIIDFGLSKFGGAQATVGPGRGRGMTGSLVTMAPEVMNEEQYQSRSDVYSFGIVCWEIFCGRIPFGQYTGVAQLIMKVAVHNERPEFEEEDRVPQEIQNLIKACWHQDVNERPDFLMIANTLKVIRRSLRLQEG